jgi:hypothetical protein
MSGEEGRPKRNVQGSTVVVRINIPLGSNWRTVVHEFEAKDLCSLEMP